ncbi:M20 family metallo-hydrolase [soil metagenome]
MQELILANNSSTLKEMSETAISLLKELIEIPSFSREESKTADVLQDFLESHEVTTLRYKNNIWATNSGYDKNLPTILLNSHHDTVKPNSRYTLNPFEAKEKDEKIYGLGSNDAGGALVSLLLTFLNFNSNRKLKYNLVFAATAEEEISGENGIVSIIDQLGKIDFAIVGEPTEMKLAIAEKGLLVLDCIAKGKAAHAAHDNPDNAIVNAFRDIDWINKFQFPQKSEMLGDVKMNVTMINAGTQHNVIPGKCEFVVDIRTTDIYKNTEVLEILKANITSEILPRSLRLNASAIDKTHPIIAAAMECGIQTFGSSTLSDQALLNFPSVKIGPGNSLRSHSGDEFIFIEEIENGIELYIEMLSKIIEI